MKRREPSDDSNESEDIEDESFDVIDEPIIKKRIINPSNTPRNLPTTKSSITNESWVDKYSPKTTNDICINPTKLKQLKQLMEEMITHQNRKILVITGPSGSSKSTSVKLLSKELGNGYVEYFNNNSSSNNFDEFLNDCKYLTGKNLKFILVEELPNIFHKPVLNNFRIKLLEWLYLNQSLPPIIICLTELERNFGNVGDSTSNEFFNIENNLNINTVLGKEILSHSKVGVIKFNSIANKFMKSMMNRIIKQESKIFKLIPQNHVNNFLNLINDIGDIRSSINNLELWSKFYGKGTVDFIDSNDENYNRNITINLFHAIGKILYASSKYKSTNMSNNDANFLTIEDVLNNYENLQLLNLSILENYTNLITDDCLKDSEFISDRLSESDLIYDLMEGKDTMIRSVRVGLDQCKLSTSKSTNNSNKFNRITFSKNFNMVKSYNKIYKKIQILKNNPMFCHESFDTINLLDGYYIPMIISNKYHEQFHRIGGSFNGKSLDDNLFGDSNDLEQSNKNDYDNHDNDNDNDYDYEEDNFEKFNQFTLQLNNNLQLQDNLININHLEDEILSDPVEDTDDDDDHDDDDDKQHEQERKPLPFESDYEFLDESDFL